MVYCSECKIEHEELAYCTECGSCLYKHSRQRKDDNYPLFECTKCGQVNFWD